LSNASPTTISTAAYTCSPILRSLLSLANLEVWPSALKGSKRWGNFSAREWKPDAADRPLLRATFDTLPEGYHLLVGKDIDDLDEFAEKIKTALVWGISLRFVLAGVPRVSIARRTVGRIGGPFVQHSAAHESVGPMQRQIASDCSCAHTGQSAPLRWGRRASGQTIRNRQNSRKKTSMDTSAAFDSSPRSCTSRRLGSSARGAATARIVDVPRALLAAGLLALLLASSGHAGHARDRLSGDVQRVKMIGFTVADVDREADFFTKVLQFEKASDFRVVGREYDRMEGVFNANMRIVHLKLGEQILELTQYVSPPTGRPIPVPSYGNDAWFEHMAIVVGDMDAAYKVLQENNVRQISAHPITIPQTNPGAAGIKAIKFHDPERHDLELLYFPPGKGDPSWQKPTNKLFLGLDHTAMTVDSTEKGVTFYRDLLGFEVGGVTLNTGTTQEVLDNLFNDTCLVTAMMPVSAPPHIEFLDYKTPPGGRPMPADTKANDLWHWQTTLVTKDIQAATDRLRKAGVRFITPDVVAIPQDVQAQFGFNKAVMVRDPNGHAIRLIEE